MKEKESVEPQLSSETQFDSSETSLTSSAAAIFEDGGNTFKGGKHGIE